MELDKERAELQTEVKGLTNSLNNEKINYQKIQQNLTNEQASHTQTKSAANRFQDSYNKEKSRANDLVASLNQTCSILVSSNLTTMPFAYLVRVANVSKRPEWKG